MIKEVKKSERSENSQRSDSLWRFACGDALPSLYNMSVCDKD